jgi:hypothetical protein
MIAQADAVKIFHINIDRTNKLIEAVDKIKAYNWIYQQRTAETEPHFLPAVTQVQDTQLEGIGRTCAEHAIISLATTFETYYSELLQELLATKPDYFTSQPTDYTHKISDLLSNAKLYTYDEIEMKLRLQGRKGYDRFFQSYNIPFIVDDKERELIEYIYAWRNHFVHSANRPDPKRDRQLSTIKPPLQEVNLITEAKRLRTSITRLIAKIDARVKASVYK